MLLKRATGSRLSCARNAANLSCNRSGPRGAPRSQEQAEGDKTRERQRRREDVSPSDEGNHPEDQGKRPSDKAEVPQRVLRESRELKCKDSREQQQDGNEEPEPRKEVPIGACHSLDLKLSGLEGTNDRVHTPARIDAAEAEQVGDAEEDQQHRGDSIQEGGTHIVWAFGAGLRIALKLRPQRPGAEGGRAAERKAPWRERNSPTRAPASFKRMLGCAPTCSLMESDERSYPSCISGGTSGFIKEAPPSA